MTAQSICVVHLARAANGFDPLYRFLDSYRSHPAGVPHALLIVFKGFDGSLPDEYELVLRNVPHERRFVPDVGYDIDVYFTVARTSAYEAFCFLNSYSVILVDEWLAKLYRALSLDGVGMVGATGSWQSMVPSLAERAVMPRSLRPARPKWQQILLRMFPIIRWVRRWIRWVTLARHFDPFPNGHLRTNAFMLTRETALRVHVSPSRTKADAYRFESGRRGLTSQVRRWRKRVLVVGKDGEAYDVDDWYQSNTFWRSNQENLLISDNQTRVYDSLAQDDRRYLSYAAWGTKTDTT